MKKFKKRTLTVLALLFAPAIFADDDKKEDYILEEGCYHIDFGANFIQFCIKEKTKLFSIKEEDIIPSASIKNVDEIQDGRGATQTLSVSADITYDNK